METEIRKITSEEIEKGVYQAIKECSFTLPEGVKELFYSSSLTEEDFRAKRCLEILSENAQISKEELIPLCQDCGSVIGFFEIGNQVHITGDVIETAFNNAIKKSYKDLNLRASIVSDPLERTNTQTNTPGFLHTELVAGDGVTITIYLKGGGSENMTSLGMFKPTDSEDAIIDFIRDEVTKAGPNPCPPLFLGIGIGGTADVALLNSKKAVLRGVNTRHTNPRYQKLEEKIYQVVNKTGIGPMGFGGNSTALKVYIKEAPCHIASLPVAVNCNCHSLRYAKVQI